MGKINIDVIEVLLLMVKYSLIKVMFIMIVMWDLEWK